MGIHATGMVKLVSISTGLLFIINPFIIFVLFKMNLSPAFAYVSIICVNFILSIIDIFILKHNEHRISIGEIISATIRVILVVLITIAVVYLVCQYKTGKAFLDIIIIGVTSCLLMGILGFFVTLNKGQRKSVIMLVRNKIKK